MDAAIVDYCRVGYTRVGVYNTQWDEILTTFKNYADYNVTRHRLVLGDADATTGWYNEIYMESTIEMILLTKDAQQIAIQLGSYVRLDVLGMTTDVVEEGDRIEASDGTLYLVKTVKPNSLGDSFSHRECQLERLSLYREGS